MEEVEGKGVTVCGSGGGGVCVCEWGGGGGAGWLGMREGERNPILCVFKPTLANCLRLQRVN